MQAYAQGMQQASAGMSGLRAGTLSARTWAAPRLEGAADYTTATMAPAVSAALLTQIAPWVDATLRSTARQVSVPNGQTGKAARAGKAKKATRAGKTVKARQRGSSSQSSVRSGLAWTALIGAVLAGAGAVGVMAWRRYRAASATNPDIVVAGDVGTTTTTTTRTTKAGTATAGSTSAADEATEPMSDPARTAW
jgi:hypothetical protein